MSRIARGCERACCALSTIFPLAFVYSISTWAVWVEVRVGFQDKRARPCLIGPGTSILGAIIYLLAMSSYTSAVFTDPGSPVDGIPHGGSSRRHEYSQLPTTEAPSFGSVTVNSAGGSRYCKKCHCPKPDRAHHCSTCKRCILKMDHHCPWLATCVGQCNHKAFMLFLIYVSLFAWVCFAVTGATVYREVRYDVDYVTDMSINVILLSVVGATVGLVLSGFTSWHISLAVRGLTTIERMEKTRYLPPTPRVPPPAQQPPIAAGNPPPPSPRSPAQRSLHIDLERARQRAQYDEYLDSIEGESLPHAFDLGWRTNLTHLFGPRPLFWALPVRNTTGDGWNWVPSVHWLEVRERIRDRRMARMSEYGMQDQGLNQSGTAYSYGYGARRPPLPPPSYSSAAATAVNEDGADDMRPGTGVSMKTLTPRPGILPGTADPRISEAEWRNWD